MTSKQTMETPTDSSSQPNDPRGQSIIKSSKTPPSTTPDELKITVPEVITAKELQKALAASEVKIYKKIEQMLEQENQRHVKPKWNSTPK
jgi:hypothetical protein